MTSHCLLQDALLLVQQCPLQEATGKHYSRAQLPPSKCSVKLASIRGRNSRTSKQGLRYLFKVKWLELDAAWDLRFISQLGFSSAIGSRARWTAYASFKESCSCLKQTKTSWYSLLLRKTYNRRGFFLLHVGKHLQPPGNTRTKGSIQTLSWRTWDVWGPSETPLRIVFVFVLLF